MRSKVHFVAGLIATVLVATLFSRNLSAQTKDQPLKVGGDVKAPKLTKYVPPEYPKEAQDKGVKGIAMLAVLINDAGAVDSVKVLKSPAEVATAAEKAVLQWRYEPTIVGGKPVWVSVTVSVPFPPKKN